MSMKKSDLDKQLGKKVGGQMKVGGRRRAASARARPTSSTGASSVASTPPPAWCRSPASCRPTSPTRCARRAPAAPTASTASSPSCCGRRSSDRRRERMSDAGLRPLHHRRRQRRRARRAHGGAARRARRASPRTRALGGTCVNLGCIPKKLYSFAAHYAESFEEAHGFGWSVGASSLRLGDAEGEPARRDRPPQRRLRPAARQAPASTLLRGRARVVGAHAVEVGGVRHRAERIVVATGGWPVAADVPGGERAITLERDLRPGALPARLVVVGGGYIACEFASIFNGLGAAGDAALSRRAGPARLRSTTSATSSPTRCARRASTSASARRCARSRPRGRRRDARRSRATAASSTADTVLYATGRVPNTAGLGLEAVGVTLDVNGAVVVDERYRTQRAEHLRGRRRHRPRPAHAGRARRGDGAGRRSVRRRRARSVDYAAHPDRRLHPSEHRHDRPLGRRRARPLRARSASTAPTSGRCATRCRAAASAR